MLIKWRCDVSTVYSIWGGGAAIWRFHVKSTVGRMAEGKSRNYIIWKYKRAHNNSEQKTLKAIITLNWETLNQKRNAINGK